MSTANQPLLAFFSYSRVDLDFAMRLATDLRRYGASAWLDKLDIRPGEHWDKAVEQALAQCPRMILILSPDSVASTNVMDEVSFALEEHKLVIPVLHRDCKIPFRLRRVQYIDARSNYEEALQELLRQLGMTTGVAAPVSVAAAASQTDRATVFPDVSTAAPRSETPPLQATQTGQIDWQLVQAEHERIEAQRIARETQKASKRIRRQLLLDAPAWVTGAMGGARAPSRRLLFGAVAAVVVLSVIFALASSRSNQANTSFSPTTNARQFSNPVFPAQTSTLQHNASEGDKAAKPFVSTKWVGQVVEAFQGPSVDALRPYFSSVVAPFYNLPSADWAAIATDRKAYFARFKTLKYRVVGQPQFTPAYKGGTLKLDVAYDAVWADGRRAIGTNHLTLTLVSGDWVSPAFGIWKISGIQER
jgi:TIR domain